MGPDDPVDGNADPAAHLGGHEKRLIHADHLLPSSSLAASVFLAAYW